MLQLFWGPCQKDHVINTLRGIFVFKSATLDYTSTRLLDAPEMPTTSSLKIYVDFPATTNSH